MDLVTFIYRIGWLTKNNRSNCGCVEPRSSFHWCRFTRLWRILVRIWPGISRITCRDRSFEIITGGDLTRPVIFTHSNLVQYKSSRHECAEFMCSKFLKFLSGVVRRFGMKWAKLPVVPNIMLLKWSWSPFEQDCRNSQAPKRGQPFKKIIETERAAFQLN